MRRVGTTDSRGCGGGNDDEGIERGLVRDDDKSDEGAHEEDLGADRVDLQVLIVCVSNLRLTATLSSQLVG